MKKKAFDLIHNTPLVDRSIYILIILNIISLILESYASLKESLGTFLYVFEVFSVIIFTIEYLVRLWTADMDPKYKDQKRHKRFCFIFSSYGIIDLLAIIPFYLPFLFPFDLRSVRILRFFRLLRIFKIGRYSKSMLTIQTVYKKSKAELAVTLFVAFILLILSSSLMYYVERDAQPENFASIGHSLWWATATLTTIGYGDVFPVTAVGKILSAVIALIGVGFIALPTGIISSTFIETLQEQKEKERKKCPHCGEDL